MDVVKPPLQYHRFVAGCTASMQGSMLAKKGAKIDKDCFVKKEKNFVNFGYDKIYLSSISFSLLTKKFCIYQKQFICQKNVTIQ